MTFETELREVDDSIDRQYLDLVVNSYKPLFLKIGKKATEHMRAEHIPLLDLGIHTRLVFKNDGSFYTKDDKPVELRNLPRIYQEESDYIAGCADNRGHVTPSVHSAMNRALSDFREKVRKSLANTL